jgi:flagellar protein FliO/FliZ
MDAAAMDSTGMYLKVMFAFALVVALMLGFSWLLKKLGLATPGMAAGGRRRLKIVEHLPLDTRRRLVLVRRDDREHLIVIGGQGGDLLVEGDIPAATESAAGTTVLPLQKDTQNAG